MSRLAIHSITLKSWDLATLCAKLPGAGVRGIGLWRQWLEGRPLAESRLLLDDAGVQAVSLVRGGFFVAATEAGRQRSLDDNRWAIEQAVAVGAPQIVLVCGADPGVPLPEARRQIEEGLAELSVEAAAAGVRLAIEPLHPMYADCRSAINTLGQCNDLIDRIDHPALGIALDAYHVWWDPQLFHEIARAGQRIIGFHVCDWLTPTTDLLNDRGLMGEGCIDLRALRVAVEATGFRDWVEVEIFSNRHWARPTEVFLAEIVTAYQQHV